MNAMTSNVRHVSGTHKDRSPSFEAIRPLFERTKRVGTASSCFRTLGCNDATYLRCLRYLSLRKEGHKGGFKVNAATKIKTTTSSSQTPT